jgi:lipopolysaccharide transport system permease protein
MILLAFSVSMILAAMNVRYRDVKYALPFLIQIWLFVTPIIYPIAFLTPKMKRFLAFNPMAGFLEGFRSSLFNTGHMDWRLVGTSVIITIFLLIVGATYFRRTERSFADIV